MKGLHRWLISSMPLIGWVFPIRYVRRLVFEQRLPYVKIGKFIRFELAELEAWIDDRRVEAKHRRPA